jgi:hypothetical protein
MISKLNLSLVIVLSTILITSLTAGVLVSDLGTADAKQPQPKPKPQPKTVKVAHISADIDASKVIEAGANVSDIYTVVLSSGNYVSKAKQLEGNSTTDNFSVQFAGKLLASTGDSFTITLVSNDEQYNTVSGTGVFTEKTLGNSGKSQLLGNTEISLEVNDQVGVS